VLSDGRRVWILRTETVPYTKHTVIARIVHQPLIAPGHTVKIDITGPRRRQEQTIKGRGILRLAVQTRLPLQGMPEIGHDFPHKGVSGRLRIFRQVFFGLQEKPGRLGAGKWTDALDIRRDEPESSQFLQPLVNRTVQRDVVGRDCPGA